MGRTAPRQAAWSARLVARWTGLTGCHRRVSIPTVVDCGTGRVAGEVALRQV